MNVTPPLVAAPENINVRLRHYDDPAVTSVHVTHTAQQARH
jgi:hypothetical protein